MIIDKLINLK